ncbi:MAG: LacI family DNA-binding transcriptional regulator [Marinovum algicola]|jgi:DNA-binding LacI/PurR family transcriptional regulator|uniref:Transcriptional regulator, LacI family n=1 Tax=Marinovum algicola TaxID=42444 RepID=A0A975ZPU4_9RHOB|nr:LacI family DNA-binding transcriptional regulator [Marinovum algicola]SEJ95847.1 transcriptional regulator, LacI family [Marinovum algicola]SLN68797.1 HTH-type transcriptional repressor CytR [Marinovum algicola]
MAVTLREVALRAGVSRSAVSRTFTEGASVSAKTRAKVEKAARELGYSPNALASSLTTGRTKMVGMVSNNFHNPIFLEVFDLFTRGLQDRGLRPLLLNLTDEQVPEDSVRMLRQYSVDGVVVASSTLPQDFSKAFKDAGMPVVHAFGRASTAPEVHVVGIDNVASGRLAARTLLARGYRDIAFLGGPTTATTTQDRYTGFMAELASHSEVTVSHSFAGSYSFEAGRSEMIRLLESRPAEAYFCGDDVLSIGALSAIQDSGYSCPGDIGILGLNDMEMARWNNINLTTLHQPIGEIVASSIELMVATLENREMTPEARVFSCSVVERGTLRPAP